jgi:peptidoglycan/LPS O-acetylase OafA/YrhL
VVSVILFHAGFDAFAGGFLGVDIFFVISGYLITGIIQNDLERERFSILKFYERRIRRILPALIVMMLLCVPLATLTMVPDDLENFGQSLVATTLSANNILLFMTSGYFALANEFKPLMHTWSLGVEEQYYLGVPLLMWGAHRIGRRRAVWAMIVILSVASFIACLILSQTDPIANFFLIWSRAWELGAGAAVALAEPRLRRMLAVPARAAPALSLLALALIVVPMLVIGRDASLPGWATLVPVLGTCLLLAFATTADPVTRALAARPVVAAGLMSYSAYLYHQPLFAFVRITSLEEPGPLVFAALIPVTFLLAWLSWRLVEQPFRDRARMKTWKVLAFTILGSAATLGAGLAMYKTQGFHANWPELHADKGFGADANAAYVEGPRRYQGVMLPDGGEKRRLLVVGDSFGRDFLNAAAASGNLDHLAVSYVARGGCAKTLGPNLLAIAPRADHIVVSYAMEPSSLSCTGELVERLRAVTKVPLTVIGVKNFGWNNNAVMLLPESRRYQYRVKPLHEAIETNRLARETFAGVPYLDLLALMGDGEGRVPVFTPDRKFISQDRAHLTPAGAAWLGALMFAQPELADLAAKNANPAAKPMAR